MIIPHFLKYPLLSQKRADFELFKSIVELMERKEHQTLAGIHKILSIKASMNKGLTDSLKKAFPALQNNILPVVRPIVEVTNNMDPNWLVGFIEAEGCFYVSITKSKSCATGYQVRLEFILSQDSRDIDLLSFIIKTLNCGNLKKDTRNTVTYLTISVFSDLIDNLLPFLDKYSLQSVKRLDYADFCKVAQLMESKAHITELGLTQILAIKAGMNTRRETEGSKL